MKTSNCSGFTKYFLSIILAITFTTIGYTQITLVEFMKVKGNVNEYLQVELEWKKVHQRRLDNEMIYAWYLVRRHFGGTDAEYDYMVITVLPSTGSLNDPYPEYLFEGLDEEILNRTDQLRDLVKTEVFDTPISTEIIHLPKYLNMDFMKVEQGLDDEYLTLEDEVWKPAHLERKKMGVMTSWSVYRQLYPGGYGGEYNYVVASGFMDMKKVTFGPEEGWDVLMKNVHPNLDFEDILSRTFKSRLMIRTELWELVYGVYPQ